MSELGDLFKEYDVKIVVTPNHKILVLMPAEDGPYDGCSKRELLVMVNLFQQLGQFEGYLTGSREKGQGVFVFPSQSLPLELLPFVKKNLAICEPEMRRGMTEQEIQNFIDSGD